MGKILDNPKEFFESLSEDEFCKLLDDYGFEYQNKTDLKINLLYTNKKGVSEGIIINNIPKPNNNGFCEIQLSKDDVIKLVDAFRRILNEEELQAVKETDKNQVNSRNRTRDVRS